MSVEEGPRGHDEEEGKRSSAEANVECKFDILEEEADDERDGLGPR